MKPSSLVAISRHDKQPLVFVKRRGRTFVYISRLLVLRKSVQTGQFFKPRREIGEKRVLVFEPLLREGKFPQLVTHHVLCHLHREIVFSVMN